MYMCYVYEMFVCMGACVVYIFLRLGGWLSFYCQLQCLENLRCTVYLYFWLSIEHSLQLSLSMTGVCTIKRFGYSSLVNALIMPKYEI